MGPDQAQKTPKVWRKIRSFVRRPGRLTPAQEAAIDLWLPEYAYPSERLADAKRTVMEIGFGNGQALIHMAQAEPEAHLIGVEVHPPGVGRLLLALKSQGIDNVSVAMTDAVELLEQVIAPKSLDEVRIYFPDPWPKKKHHKRRLIQAPFIQLLAEKLKPQGRVHLATDWMPYAEWMEEVFAESDLYEKVPNAHHHRPKTHFQKRGERRGHAIVDLIYVRTQEVSA